MANEILDTTNKLMKPVDISISDDTVIQQLSENLQSITPDDVDSMCDDIDEAERKRKIFEEEEREKKLIEKKERKKDEENERIENTYAILNDLIENHVTIEEYTIMMGYKGKTVHIDLPAVGNFEGFKFDYFISDDTVTKRYFELQPELKRKSYSMNDISNLLQAINRYMIELKGNNDGEMDYENKLKYWKTDVSKCNAGECLKAITGLNNHYWLIDKYLQMIINPHVRLVCRYDKCCFDKYGGDVDANLLLRPLD